MREADLAGLVCECGGAAVGVVDVSGMAPVVGVGTEVVVVEDFSASFALAFSARALRSLATMAEW